MHSGSWHSSTIRRSHWKYSSGTFFFDGLTVVWRSDSSAEVYLREITPRSRGDRAERYAEATPR